MRGERAPGRAFIVRAARAAQGRALAVFALAAAALAAGPARHVFLNAGAALIVYTSAAAALAGRLAGLGVGLALGAFPEGLIALLRAARGVARALHADRIAVEAAANALLATLFIAGEAITTVITAHCIDNTGRRLLNAGARRAF